MNWAEEKGTKRKTNAVRKECDSILSNALTLEKGKQLKEQFNHCMYLSRVFGAEVGFFPIVRWCDRRDKWRRQKKILARNEHFAEVWTPKAITWTQGIHCARRARNFCCGTRLFHIVSSRNFDTVVRMQNAEFRLLEFQLLRTLRHEEVHANGGSHQFAQCTLSLILIRFRRSGHHWIELLLITTKYFVAFKVKCE